MENCNVPLFESCTLDEAHLTQGSIFQTEGPDLILKITKTTELQQEEIHFVNFISCRQLELKGFTAHNLIQALQVWPIGQGFGVQLKVEAGCTLSLECQNIIFKRADQKPQAAQP